MDQYKLSPNRPQLAGIRQINFAVNHTFKELNRNFNHLGSLKMPDLVEEELIRLVEFQNISCISLKSQIKTYIHLI